MALPGLVIGGVDIGSELTEISIRGQRGRAEVPDAVVLGCVYAGGAVDGEDVAVGADGGVRAVNELLAVVGFGGDGVLFRALAAQIDLRAAGDAGESLVRIDAGAIAVPEKVGDFTMVCVTVFDMKAKNVFSLRSR